jgi:hypothetical protein
VATKSGTGVPAAAANQTIQINLDDGDNVAIYPSVKTEALTGTTIITDEDHPVGVYPGHSCANIPDSVCCCDHLEEQISGVRLWGMSFIAPHMPIREVNNPEGTFWQIYASEDGTTVTLEADNQVTGLPGAQVMLDKGQSSEFTVKAPMGVEADFSVEADKPIAVVGYQIGSFNLTTDPKVGDPAMVQYPPVEQFLPRYVVLVPGTWVEDALILTRPAGAEILLDGVAIPDMEFSPVGNGDWEAARVLVPDGVHVLDGGEEPFGVVVVGWDLYDSYAYIGGTGTGVINPNPQG